MQTTFFSDVIEKKIRNIDLMKTSSQSSFINNEDIVSSSVITSSSNYFDVPNSTLSNTQNQQIDIPKELKQSIQDVSKNMKKLSIEKSLPMVSPTFMQIPTYDKNNKNTFPNQKQNDSENKPTIQKTPKKYKNYFSNDKDIHDSIRDVLGNEKHFISPDFHPLYLTDSTPNQDESLYDYLIRITPQTNKQYHTMKHYVHKMKSQDMDQNKITKHSHSSNKKIVTEHEIPNHTLTPFESSEIIENSRLTVGTSQSSISSLANVNHVIDDDESPSCRVRTNPPSYLSIHTNDFIHFCQHWNEWKQDYCNAMFFYYVCRLQLTLCDTMQNYGHFQSSFEWFKTPTKSDIDHIIPSTHLNEQVNTLEDNESNYMNQIVNQKTSTQLPFFSVMKNRAPVSNVDDSMLFRFQNCKRNIKSILFETNVSDNFNALKICSEKVKQKTESFVDKYRSKKKNISKENSIFNPNYLQNAIKLLIEMKKQKKILSSCKIKNCSELHLTQNKSSSSLHLNEIEGADYSIVGKIDLRNEYRSRLELVNQSTKKLKKTISEDMQMMIDWINQNNLAVLNFSSNMTHIIYRYRNDFVMEGFNLQHMYSRNITVLIQDASEICKSCEPWIVSMKSNIFSNDSVEFRVYSDLQMKNNCLFNEIENAFQKSHKPPFLFSFNKYCASNKDIVRNLSILCNKELKNVCIEYDNADMEKHVQNFLKFYMIKQFVKLHESVLSQINYHIEIIKNSCIEHIKSIQSTLTNSKNKDKNYFLKYCSSIQELCERWIVKKDKIQDHNQTKSFEAYDLFDKKLKRVCEKKCLSLIDYLNNPLSQSETNSNTISQEHDRVSNGCKQFLNNHRVRNEKSSFSKMDECAMTCYSIYCDKLDLLHHECLIHVLLDCVSQKKESV